MAVRITHHAGIRLKQRLGLTKKSHARMAERALLSGCPKKDTKARLRRYLDKLSDHPGPGEVFRVYGEFIWLFNADTLITVLPLPKGFSRMTIRD